tara:strand:- start:147 stop:425 length:279 start_codon:yes stop_codon:yes gene_type:complete
VYLTTILVLHLTRIFKHVEVCVKVAKHVVLKTVRLYAQIVVEIAKVVAIQLMMMEDSDTLLVELGQVISATINILLIVYNKEGVHLQAKRAQ